MAFPHSKWFHSYFCNRLSLSRSSFIENRKTDEQTEFLVKIMHELAHVSFCSVLHKHCCLAIAAISSKLRFIRRRDQYIIQFTQIIAFCLRHFRVSHIAFDSLAATFETDLLHVTISRVLSPTDQLVRRQ